MNTDSRSNERFDEWADNDVPRVEPDPHPGVPSNGQAEPSAVSERSDVAAPEVESEPATCPHTDPQLLEKGQRSVAASTWAALIIGSLLLILLLVFVAQNTHDVALHVAGYDFSFPLGVGILLAAVVGALIMALVGGLRMFELSRKLKKTRRALQQVESGH